MPNLLPTSELVAVAWLSANVSGVTGSMVATTLPRDTSAWAAKGFVQAQAAAGRTPDVDLPRRLPVIQVDLWGVNPDGKNPPWNLANQLAEQVRAATEAVGTAWRGKSLAMLKTGYDPARVWAVYLLTEPTRVVGDPSGYARFTLDLAIDWAPV
jgi:hypothetical protein